METLQFAFKIHGEFCKELVVCDYGSVLNTMVYTGSTAHKHFTIHTLYLFCVNLFIDYSTYIY